jgi:hypothetical protein
MNQPDSATARWHMTRRGFKDYLSALKKLVAAGKMSEAVALFMTSVVGVPAEYIGAMQSEPFWQGFEAVAPTLIYDGTITGDMMSGSLRPLARWASVRTPTLVLDGSESQPWVHSAAHAIAGILPMATHRTLSGQSHDVAPDVLAPVLVDFFLGRIQKRDIFGRKKHEKNSIVDARVAGRLRRGFQG